MTGTDRGLSDDPGAASAPRLGWYADDFTGATDTLATLSRAGLRTLLFLAIPTSDRLAAAGRLDALGIAGASRTLAPGAMAVELDPVGRFFSALGVPVLHYKCCSTFDSAPDIGSIGAAVRALRPHFSNPFLPIVGGQPNIGRYCVFSTLFAAAGTGGDVHRLDRHPTMPVHPVTPMREADLRRHLEAQGMPLVAGLHDPAYDLSPAALDQIVDRLIGQGSSAVLLDVGHEAHLAAAGRLIWARAQRAPLIAVGASSVAQALTMHWSAETGSPERSLPVEPVGHAVGPVFVMAGSLSPVTRRQIEASSSFERLQVDGGRLVGDPAYMPALVDTVAARLRAGRHVMAWTAPLDASAAEIVGPSKVAGATAAFVASVLRAVALRRLGIAGGDTSSRVVQALGFWGLSHRAILAPGVALCRGHANDPRLDGMQIMLKGGQMGQPDIFERLLRGM
ncbi:four-carbon acid sugar kinase family protein [Inquilinus limosus]|uniref:Type III effector n=1 Tax=Inquilinus limosus TaxID=171674 RepID=A0A211ZN24_9PROT|nr:four-carbon acid sugar kinase family protein [Inquilinus limosus]OWJ66675.1 hypothetical protein BWR60_13570 [Inquilinus limosus]